MVLTCRFGPLADAVQDPGPLTVTQPFQHLQYQVHLLQPKVGLDQLQCFHGPALAQQRD